MLKNGNGYNFTKYLLLTKNICKFDPSKIEPHFYKNSIKSVAYKLISYRFIINFPNTWKF